MKNTSFITLFFVLLASFASAQHKFAYAYSDTVMMSLPEFTTKRGELENYAKQLTSTLESKQKELETKYKDYQQNAPSWIPEVVKEKERELQSLQQSLMEFQQQSQANLNKKEQELLTPLNQKVDKGIADVAKEHNYGFVIPAEMLLYKNGADDITDKVIAKLGGTRPSPEKPAETKQAATNKPAANTQQKPAPKK